MGASRKNLTLNRRFGALLVLKNLRVSGDKKTWDRFECICDCGKTHICLGGNLRGGKTRSCGCQSKIQPWKNSDRQDALMKAAFGSLNNRAKNPVTISFEEFSRLSLSNCFYCGSPPKKVLLDKDKSGGLISNSKLYHNGIDKIDPSIGFVIGNMLPCCFPCNRSKSNLSVFDFIEHCKKISSHQQKKDQGKN